MLWALIVSIIIKSQIKKIGFNHNVIENTEHTPGFYELDKFRLQRYSDAMNKKLAHAIECHKNADQTMSRVARMGKPSRIKNTAFFRLRASENRVLHARELVSIANQDLNTVISCTPTATNVTNIAYDLAYRSKFDLLKYNLLKSRVK